MYHVNNKKMKINLNKYLLIIDHYPSETFQDHCVTGLSLILSSGGQLVFTAGYNYLN